MPRIELSGQRVVIVYLFDGIGDALLLGPALTALIEAGAKTPIGIIAPPNAVRALRLFDLPLRLHALDEASGEEGSAKLEAKLARHRYDIAIDLTLRAGHDSRGWLTKSGAATCLGWRTEEEAANVEPLTHGTVDRRWQAERHWSRYLVAPLNPLGISAPCYRVPFRSTASANERAASLFADRPRVALIPGSRNPSKQWGPNHFGRVGRTVTGPLAGSVVVVGAPSEAESTRAIARSIGDEARPYTQKSLDVVKELIEMSDAVVTNDTGPMHLSFLLGRPTIAVFTWMSPVCWGPWKNDPRFVVLRSPADADSDHMGAVWANAIEGYLSNLVEGRAPSR